MNDLGINQGTSGNASVRVPKGFLVTPSAVPYDAMAPDDMVLMDLDGAVLDGARKPSSEWHIHRAVLAARPDAGAVLHAHPHHATALACLGRGIPAFHYMVAVAGGRDIRCAAYAPPGSENLSGHVVEALEGRLACLMANHGMVVLGRGLTEALDRALEVENLATQYLLALQVADPTLLDDDEMDRIVELFKTYGAAGG